MTTTLYAGAEPLLLASLLSLSTNWAFSVIGSLKTEFSFTVRGVLAILKEFSLRELGPPRQHSLNLFPHRYKTSQKVRKMHTKLVTTMKTVNIFFSVGLRNTRMEKRLVNQVKPWEFNYLFRTTEERLPCDVTVHHIGARVDVAFHQRWEKRGLVDVVDQKDKHTID